MINPNFYLKENLVNDFQFSTLRHYPRKALSLSTEFFFHEVSVGENLYDIAKIYFGRFGELYWTTIADLNGVIKPDWVEVGQKLKIPKKLVEPRIEYRVIYDKNISTAIKI